MHLFDILSGTSDSPEVELYMRFAEILRLRLRMTDSVFFDTLSGGLVDNIKIRGLKNVRDLGGLQADDGAGAVHSGLLYRGGDLSKLSTRNARKFLARTGVSLVVDLRTALEREERPDIALEGVEVLHRPIFDEQTIGVTHEMKSDVYGTIADLVPDLRDLYRKMVSDACSANLSAAVRAVIEAVVDGRSVYFHCTEGKDRTGIVSLVVLSLLGTPLEDIMADYLFTNTVSVAKARRIYWLVRLAKRDKVAAEKVRAAFVAHEDYLMSAVMAIEEEWGGVPEFAERGLGIGAETIAAFRAAT